MVLDEIFLPIAIVRERLKTAIKEKWWLEEGKGRGIGKREKLGSELRNVVALDAKCGSHQAVSRLKKAWLSAFLS